MQTLAIAYNPLKPLITFESGPETKKLENCCPNTHIIVGLQIRTKESPAPAGFERPAPTEEVGSDAQPFSLGSYGNC